jgi:fumarate hydratase class II
LTVHHDIGAVTGEELSWRIAIVKRAAAIASHAGNRLAEQPYELIVQVCDEILAGQHRDMFPPTDGCDNFRKFLIEGTKPNHKQIGEYVERSLMLVTALTPVIGYDKASKIAHDALDNGHTPKVAAIALGLVTEDEFDRVVDPAKMVAADFLPADSPGRRP